MKVLDGTAEVVVVTDTAVVVVTGALDVVGTVD